jgi:hypothetical protein
MQVLLFQEDQKFWPKDQETSPRFKPALMFLQVGTLKPNKVGKIIVSDEFFANQKGTVCAIIGRYSAAQKPAFNEAIEALKTVPNVATSVWNICITDATEEQPISKPEYLNAVEIEMLTKFTNELRQIVILSEPMRGLKDQINRVLQTDQQSRKGTPDFSFHMVVTGDVPNALEALKSHPRIAELVDMENLKVALEVAHRDYQRGPAGTDRSPPSVDAHP